MFDAAQSLEKRLLLLNKMIELDASSDNSFGVTKKQHQKLIEGVRASLAVLPVAFFEDFLRNLISQFIDEINGKNPRVEWNLLPEKLRKSHIVDNITKFDSKKLSGETYSDYETRILNSFDIISEKVLSPKNTPRTYVLISEIFVQTNNNPNADRVNDTFNVIGIKNVFGERRLINKMKTFDRVFYNGDAIRFKLDSIVNRRHTVAHGRQLTGLVRQELDIDIKFIQKLAMSLQIVIRNYAKRLLK